MDKSTRIRLIQGIRDELGPMSRDDEDLVLETFGIGERPVENQWGDGPTVTAWLARVSDDDLLPLAQHLELLNNTADAVSEGEAVPDPEPLSIFASHLSAHRGYLGEVEAELNWYNIRLFVAHDSIPMDALWEKEIVDALNGCHAGAVFLHPKIDDSYYCMQEVGWILGRGIPIARLMFGESPRALLGAQQGKQLTDRSATEAAAAIVDWTLTHPTLASCVSESLTTALDDSVGYRITDMVWARLAQIPELSREQLKRVLHAAETNPQVFGTGVGGYRGRAYRQVIAEQAKLWDKANDFSNRITNIREDSSGQLIKSPDDPM